MRHSSQLRWRLGHAPTRRIRVSRLARQPSPQAGGSFLDVTSKTPHILLLFVPIGLHCSTPLLPVSARLLRLLSSPIRSSRLVHVESAARSCLNWLPIVLSSLPTCAVICM